MQTTPEGASCMFIATMHRRLEVVQILAALGGRDLLMHATKAA